MVVKDILVYCSVRKKRKVPLCADTMDNSVENRSDWFTGCLSKTFKVQLLGLFKAFSNKPYVQSYVTIISLVQEVFLMYRLMLFSATYKGEE